MQRRHFRHCFPSFSRKTIMCTLYHRSNILTKIGEQSNEQGQNFATIKRS